MQDAYAIAQFKGQNSELWGRKGFISRVECRIDPCCRTCACSPVRSRWNAWNHIMTWGSIAAFYLTMLVYNYLPFIRSPTTQPSPITGAAGGKITILEREKDTKKMSPTHNSLEQVSACRRPLVGSVVARTSCTTGTTHSRKCTL